MSGREGQNKKTGAWTPHSKGSTGTLVPMGTDKEPLFGDWRGQNRIMGTASEQFYRERQEGINWGRGGHGPRLLGVPLCECQWGPQASVVYERQGGIRWGSGRLIQPTTPKYIFNASQAYFLYAIAVMSELGSRDPIGNCK